MADRRVEYEAPPPPPPPLGHGGGGGGGGGGGDGDGDGGYDDGGPTSVNSIDNEISYAQAMWGESVSGS